MNPHTYRWTFGEWAINADVTATTGEPPPGGRLDRKERYKQVMNKLAKWRQVFAGWQLGTRLMTDPESNAVRNHRETTILLRAENNALVALLIRKGVISEDEWLDALIAEGKALDDDYTKQFPGFYSTDEGITMDLPVASETMKRLRFKP